MDILIVLPIAAVIGIFAGLLTDRMKRNEARKKRQQVIELAKAREEKCRRMIED